MSTYGRRLYAAGTITTSAVAGTEVTTAILGAPGANTRYRIFGLAVTKNPSVAAALGGAFRARLLSGADITELGVGVNMVNDHHSLEPIGVPTSAVNAAVSIVHLANIASLAFIWAVIYNVEPA